MYINHWAVLVAALANLALGALWYSPLLFYKAWQRESGMTDEKIKQGNMGLIYGLAFLMALLMSYNLAFFLGDANTDAAWGATAGFLAGFGWAAAGFVIIGLFEQRSWRYMLINGGFLVVYLTLAGLIIGAWR